MASTGYFNLEDCMELEQRTIEHDLFGKPRRKKTINQKKKGNANELVACKVMEEWVGEPFARVPSSGGLRWKEFEGVCGDIVCENKKVKFPFSVETKHLQQVTVAYKLRENSLIYGKWKQAVRDAIRAKKEPMLLIRSNGMDKGRFYLFVDEKFSVYFHGWYKTAKWRTPTGCEQYHLAPAETQG